MKTYRDWIRRLNAIARKLGYKYRLSGPEWRVYYDEGYSPGAALAEEFPLTKKMIENMIRLMERRAEFKGPILDLSNSNPFIHRIIEMYCRGIIVTREEAYCQMVVELAKTRDELLENMINEQRMKSVLFTGSG